MYNDAYVVDESLTDGVVFYSETDNCHIAVVYRNTLDYMDEHNGYRISRGFLQTCAEKYGADRVVVVEKLTNVWYEFDLDDYFNATELPPRMLLPTIARGESVAPDVVLDLSFVSSTNSLLD